MASNSLPTNSLSSAVMAELTSSNSSSTVASVRNKFDAVVLVLHYTLKQLGFELVGIGESDSSNTATSSSPTTGTANNAQSNNDNTSNSPLPSNWNQSLESYSFRYKHSRKPEQRFVIKALRMENTLFIHGKVEKTEKSFSTEVSTTSFVPDESQAIGSNASNLSRWFRDFESLVAKLKNDVVGKLVDSNTSNTLAGYSPFNEPLRVGPPGYQPTQPDWYDDDDNYGGAYYQPPFGIGSGDVFPTMPGIGGMGGPPGNLIGPGQFQPYTPGGGGQFPRGGGRGGRGGRPYVPGRNPGGPIPPGARFDPYTPFDPRGRNPDFGPDPDEFPPPGRNNNNNNSDSWYS